MSVTTKCQWYFRKQIIDTKIQQYYRSKVVGAQYESKGFLTQSMEIVVELVLVVESVPLVGRVVQHTIQSLSDQWWLIMIIFVL